MARPIAEEFGRAFRAAYESAGLTQVELATRLRDRGWTKVDQSFVSKWVRGVAVPPLEVLPDVDAACGMPGGYVLTVAGYVDLEALVDLDDPDEAKLWAVKTYSQAERLQFIAQARNLKRPDKPRLKRRARRNAS